ncbi:hypothetical protein HW555_005871 [Spodoptera exigua]|uniref:C2H2-type domain-containing protein n=1 Tax=Spodoptera exigua TaxID=7107 RepID=A0A835GJN8_SPOEX|nr:hypothetical protein HW555_005871 [Spodoptera exigua]
MEAKVECERVLVLCYGCLSADRKISCVTGRIKTLFTKLRGDRKNENDNTDILLCWECTALLNKTQQFQTQIKSAQRQLADHLHGYMNDKNKFSTYTQLTKTKRKEYDYEYIYEEKINEKDFLSTQNEIDNESENKEKLLLNEEENLIEDSGVLLQEIKEEYNNEIKDEVESLNLNGNNDEMDYYDTEWQMEEDGPLQKKTKKKRNNISQSIKKYANYATFRNIRELFTDEVSEFYDQVNLDYSDVDEIKLKAVYNKSKFACKTCKVGFRKYMDYARHNVFRHSKDAPNSHLPGYCGICKKDFKNFYAYVNKHLKYYHPELIPVTFNAKMNLTSQELRYCVECDKQFSSVYLYKKHIKDSVKHTPKPKVSIPCPVCNKIFSKKSYRNNHYNLFHTNGTKHYCELCDKYFANGFGKRNHLQRVHQKIPNPKDKICDLCGRGFSTNRILANHRRTHTGERPYKCQYCPASFAQKYAMMTHQKTQHKNVN